MVGSAVRAARKRVGMSQAELARKAGTSQPSIARLEQGRVSPTVISLERIARALKSELVVDFEPLSVPSGHQPSERPTDSSKRALRSRGSVIHPDPQSAKRRTGSNK
jgi:transcriptional regulator with XRE-family HTH domain